MTEPEPAGGSGSGLAEGGPLGETALSGDTRTGEAPSGHARPGGLATSGDAQRTERGPRGDAQLTGNGVQPNGSSSAGTVLPPARHASAADSGAGTAAPAAELNSAGDREDRKDPSLSGAACSAAGRRPPSAGPPIGAWDALDTPNRAGELEAAAVRPPPAPAAAGWAGAATADRAPDVIAVVLPASAAPLASVVVPPDPARDYFCGVGRSLLDPGRHLDDLALGWRRQVRIAEAVSHHVQRRAAPAAGARVLPRDAIPRPDAQGGARPPHRPARGQGAGLVPEPAGQVAKTCTSEAVLRSPARLPLRLRAGRGASQRPGFRLNNGPTRPSNRAANMAVWRISRRRAASG